MKFFNERVITEDHVSMIKEFLRVYRKHKIINYNNNFIEHSEMEKGIFILDRNNEILKLVEEHLEPWLDPWNVIQRSIEQGELVGYDYRKLPLKLRQYMYSVDQLFFNIWFNRMKYRTSEADYDSRHERLLVLIPDYTDEEYERYVLLGNPLPTALGKKARDSARRSYKTVNEIIKCNIDKFTHFITLTVANPEKMDRHRFLNETRLKGEESIEFAYISGDDFELVKKHFTQTMASLSKKMKRKGIPLEYIAVWELQGNGNYHFHMLSTEIPKEELYEVPEWLDYNHLERKRNNGMGLRQWKHGKSDVQLIKNKARLTTYVSKYIIKSFQNVREETYSDYLNKKKYFVTTGLNRPTYEYFSDDIDEGIKAILGEEEPFVKEYTNPYNHGLITKRQYSLV